MPKRFVDAAAILSATAIYFALGKFGLSLAFVNASASAVWPPTGFALAALLLWGARLWPAVLIGAFLVNITTQGSWATSLGIASGNTCETLVGVWLVNRFANGTGAFDRPDLVLKFFAAAIFSTAISASFGVTTLILGGFATTNQFLKVWITWWLGDLVSAVVIAPFLLIWITKPLPRPPKAHPVEAAVLSFILAVIAWFVFLEPHPVASTYQLKYLALPPIVWAAFRFGLQGAITSSLAVSAIAVWGTLRGQATTAALDPNQALLLFQAYTGTITLTSLVLASAMFERRDAEQTLHEIQARKSAVLDSALDCIITIDHQGKIVELNAAVERTFGYSRDELLGKEMAELIIPERYRAAHYKGLAHYLTSGEGPVLGKRIELAAIRRDGTEFPVELGIVAIEREGRPLFTGTLRDITQRKEAEQALRRTLGFNEAIMMNMGEGLYTVDAEGLVTFMNPAAERLFGWTLDELRGKKMHDVTHYKHPDGTPFPAEECAGFQVLRKGKTLTNHEDVFIRKDGTFFDVVYSSSPIREGSSITGLVVVFRDETERKRAQEALRQAQEELLHQNEKLEHTVQERTAKLRETIGELESYSYSISHDMRAPLRAMQAYAEVLLNEHREHLDPTAQRYLDRIVASSNRLDKLIVDVLSYSRISRAEVDLERIDLDRLLDDIVNEYPALRAAEVELCNPLGSVTGAEALLTQAISNLMTNAAKFAKPGETARIKVWSEESVLSGKPAVKLFIQDNGIGIAQRDQQRIFDIFVRLHGEKEYEGTGIGLSIVKKAIERMGGQIGVTSEPDHGSTFWIQLPKA